VKVKCLTTLLGFPSLFHSHFSSPIIELYPNLVHILSFPGVDTNSYTCLIATTYVIQVICYNIFTCQNNLYHAQFEDIANELLHEVVA